MKDYTELPQANHSDALSNADTVPWIVCAGAYLEPTLIVWAKSDHYEDVFELFVEWADENAPGLLTSFDDDDYREAAAALGLVWRGHNPDDYDGDGYDLERIREHAEAGHTIVGHTSLDNGTHVASWEWSASECPDQADALARAAWKLGDDLPELEDSTLAQLNRAGLVDVASAV